MNKVIKDTQQHDLSAAHHHISDMTTKVNGAQLIVEVQRSYEASQNTIPV